MFRQTIINYLNEGECCLIMIKKIRKSLDRFFSFLFIYLPIAFLILVLFKDILEIIFGSGFLYFVAVVHVFMLIAVFIIIVIDYLVGGSKSLVEKERDREIWMEIFNQKESFNYILLVIFILITVGISRGCN